MSYLRTAPLHNRSRRAKKNNSSCTPPLKNIHSTFYTIINLKISHLQTWHRLSWSSNPLDCMQFLMAFRVLMLGAGFVTAPTLDILTTDGIEVTVGKLSTHELCKKQY